MTDAGGIEMKDAVGLLKKYRVIPVIEIEDTGLAVRLAETLMEGGIPAAEITFRTEAAESAIRAIHEAAPEVFLLAGTVLDVETAERAVEAGADAIVSPGTNPEVVKWCVEHDIPVFPGCMTPTEVESCRRMGLHLVKFFPAEAAGGVPMLKALSGPYKDMEFMPTGGITPENLPDYLALPNVAACGGSFLVPKKLLAEGDFDGILQILRELKSL